MSYHFYTLQLIHIKIISNAILNLFTRICDFQMSLFDTPSCGVMLYGNLVPDWIRNSSLLYNLAVGPVANDTILP